MPTNGARQIVEKTVVTGAIGGLAVAAAGGDKDAVREGFLLSGAMVLVQTGYQAATDHPLDPKVSSSARKEKVIAIVRGGFGEADSRPNRPIRCPLPTKMPFQSVGHLKERQGDPLVR
jgi:hypothetical protein